MKHGVYKRDSKNWEVYFEDSYRGTYPQRKIAKGHFQHLLAFWAARDAAADPEKETEKS
jgi:hypothetical protein